MQGARPCVICGERDGHSVAPLRHEGFFRPPGRRPRGGGDDDNERAGAAATAIKKLNPAGRPRALRIGRHLIATTAI